MNAKMLRIQRRKMILRLFGVFGLLLLVRFLWIETPHIYMLTLNSTSASKIPWVKGQLKSKDPQTRSTAAQSLGNIGRAAQVAIPELLVALHDESPQVAAHAAWSLGCINGMHSNPAVPFRMPVPVRPEVIRALIDALDHSDGEVRRYAAYALSMYGPRAKLAIPHLAKKLNDEHMGYMAARALGQIGIGSRDAVPQIAGMLTSSQPGVRAEAAESLSYLTPLSDEVVAAVARLTADEDTLVRDIASRAADRIRSSQLLPANKSPVN